MVPMAESVQDQGLSAGTSEFSKERGEAVGSRRSMKQARHAVTRFRGVRPKANGRFGAQIWDPSRGGYVWLGTYGTAEDAAQAYGAAAVELQAEGRVAKKTAARLAARNEYRGVQRTLSGRYAAQIGHSRGKARTWLGTFATAEDAARAYDAAAGKLHGARAITNFEQPSDDKGATEVTIPVPAKSHSWTELRGVRRTPSGKYGAQIGQWERKARTPLLGTFGSVEDAAAACDAATLKLYGAEARTNIEQPPAGATADDGQESSVDLLNDFFSEMPALQFLSDSSISGAQLDDLWASLAPAERQLVDGFLKDTDFSGVVP